MKNNDTSKLVLVFSKSEEVQNVLQIQLQSHQLVFLTKFDDIETYRSQSISLIILDDLFCRQETQEFERLQLEYYSSSILLFQVEEINFSVDDRIQIISWSDDFAIQNALNASLNDNADIPYISVEDNQNVALIFFEEANELLRDIDALVIRLESHPSDREVIDLLFRRIHSIKGGVGAIPNTQNISDLTISLENLLDAVRSEKISFGTVHVDILLQSMDVLRQLIQKIRNQESPSSNLVERGQLISRTIEKLAEGSDKGLEATVDMNLSTDSALSDEDGVWLSNDQLSQFLDLTSELIILKNFHQTIHRTLDFKTNPDTYLRRQNEFMESLTKVSDALQKQMTRARQVALSVAFNKLPRVMKQICSENQKIANLETQGLELLVEKQLAKDLSFCVIHLLRNSLDHGIEAPEERRRLGKPSHGKIQLSVSESQGVLYFEFRDDGRGVNIEKVKEKAIRVGIRTEDELNKMSEADVVELIFHAGFSTRDEVTDISGRGVGMDVVLSTIRANGGVLKTESKQGVGLVVRAEIPLQQTVRVENAIITDWKNSIFAIPVNSIVRIVQGCETILTETHGRRFAQIDNVSVPLLSYDELVLNDRLASREDVRKKQVIVFKEDGQYLALLVDRIHQQTEVVVRNFDSIVKSIEGCKGSSILGDTEIAFLISPKDLVRIYKKSFSNPFVERVA